MIRANFIVLRINGPSLVAEFWAPFPRSCGDKSAFSTLRINVVPA